MQSGTPCAVVFNPAAAGGRTGRRWKTLEPLIRERLPDARFYPSEGPGGGIDAAKLAVEEGKRIVLSLGGDGTHNEVVNGIMAAGVAAGIAPGAVSFGVLPAGTGGDFARMLGLPNDPVQALDLLLTRGTQPLDLGRVHIESVEPAQERYFVNVATFGFGGLVDTFVNRSGKALGGRASFFIATLRALAIYRPALVRLVLDGEELGEFRINTVALGNGRYCGGGMKVTPEAEPGDGLLDVVVIEQRSTMDVLGLTRRIYAGTHLDASFVHSWKGKELQAFPVGEDPAWLDIDGEALGILPARFEVVPGALTLLGASVE